MTGARHQKNRRMRGASVLTEANPVPTLDVVDGWPLPQRMPPIEAFEIHAWRVDLKANRERVSQLAEQLAPDELARASRFVFQRDQRRYIVARATLRSLLAAYTGESAAEIQFGYGSHGKPYLRGTQEGERVVFNISHSSDLALFVVSRGMEIGVDVEYIATDIEVEEIANSFFSEQETSVIRSLPAPRRCELFFRLWTRKEAFVKARGQGLSIPIREFDFSRIPAGAGLHPFRALGESWWLCGLEPEDEFAAALVCRTRPVSLLTFTAGEVCLTR